MKFPGRSEVAAAASMAIRVGGFEEVAVIAGFDFVVPAAGESGIE